MENIYVVMVVVGILLLKGENNNKRQSQIATKGNFIDRIKKEEEGKDYYVYVGGQ